MENKIAPKTVEVHSIKHMINLMDYCNNPMDSKNKEVFATLFLLAKKQAFNTPMFEYCYYTKTIQGLDFLVFKFNDGVFDYYGHIIKRGYKINLVLSRVRKLGNKIIYEVFNEDCATYRKVSLHHFNKKILKPLYTLNQAK